MYDTNYGRLATMTDGIGTTTYSYQAVSTAGALNIASIDGPLSNDTISYTYDALGRVATRTLGSTTTSWDFDALGRLDSLTDPIGTFGFAYDGQTTRLAQLSYPNGQTSSYSYFGNTGDRRLQEIHHQTASSTTLSKFNYAYDVVGNITTWTQQYESTTRAYDFGYDGTDQLTSAVYRTTGGSPTILKRYGYSYDPVGNRTNEQTDDAPTGWTYDTMNRLTAQAGTAQLKFEGTVNEAATVTVGGKPATVNGSGTFVGSAAVTNGTNTVAISATDASGNTRTQEYEVEVTSAGGTFSYDANGNLTARGTRTYSWDAENRLVQVADDGTPIASFTYDGAGRRASKAAGGATQNFVYEGRDILEDRIVSGVTTRHVHGPAVDQPLASVDGSGNPTYYLTDHLGSIVQTTDASGAVTLTRQYDPYGNLQQGDTTSGYAFTGREWDAEIGLYYYRARYYDPQLGRFVSEDPIGFVGGANFYAYVENKPGSQIDPDGLEPCGCGDIKVPYQPWFADLRENIRRAERSRWMILALPRLVWFGSGVKPGGEWDYKQWGYYEQGKSSAFEDFGNFNYGVTGAAAGIQLTVLVRLAGAVQWWTGPYDPKDGRPWGKYPHGDQKRDQDQIIAGWYYYHYGCYK